MYGKKNGKKEKSTIQLANVGLTQAHPNYTHSKQLSYECHKLLLLAMKLGHRQAEDTVTVVMYCIFF